MFLSPATAHALPPQGCERRLQREGYNLYLFHHQFALHRKTKGWAKKIRGWQGCFLSTLPLIDIPRRNQKANHSLWGLAIVIMCNWQGVGRHTLIWNSLMDRHVRSTWFNTFLFPSTSRLFFLVKKLSPHPISFQICYSHLLLPCLEQAWFLWVHVICGSHLWGVFFSI